MQENRRTFLKKAGAAGVAACSGPLLQSSSRGKKKPNIILILGDDVSAKEFSCYGGNGINTPTIDRLAAEGVMFRTAWATPLCGPSRACLYTGRYAWRQKFYDNAVLPAYPLWEKNLLMGQVMKSAGYATAKFGKIHFGGDPHKNYGYDEYCIAQYWEGYDGPWQELNQPKQGMYAIQWYWHPGLVANGKGVPTGPNDFGPDIEVERLNDFVRRHRQQPFFAYYPTNLPHMFHSKADRWKYTDVPELDRNGNRTGGRIKGSLKADLEYLDRLVGRIIKNLEDLGIRDNTIIIFCGDNGTAGYGKNRLEDERALHVPFIVNAPGLVQKIGPCDELVDFSDVLPTLAELAGAKFPDGYATDGHSFAPLLLGRPFQPREWIFSQLHQARWLRDKRWLLDGYGRFWDCGQNRDETKGYLDVTFSDSAEVIAARKRFEKILDTIPKPDFDDPDTKASWQRFLADPNNPAAQWQVYRPPYLDK